MTAILTVSRGAAIGHARSIQDCVLIGAVFIVGFAAGTPRAANARTIDVVLDAALDPPALYPPGTQGVLTLTARNLGPTDSPGVSVVTTSFLVYGPGENIIVFPTAATAPCRFFVDVISPVPCNPYPMTAIVLFGPISSGALHTCTVGVVSQAGATGTFELRLTAAGAAPGVTETNPDNNVRTFLLVISGVVAQQVPALGQFASMVLVLLAIALAAMSKSGDGIARFGARTASHFSQDLH